MEQQQHLIFLGKGAFTYAELNTKTKKVILTSRDPVKECMAHKRFPDSRLFPKIDFYKPNDSEHDQHPYKTYIMDYYPIKATKTNLKPDQYELYKTLRQIYQYLAYVPPDARFLRQTFARNQKLTRAQKKNLIHAVEALMNYENDVCFEISPRNARATKSGNLLLLDCFFLNSHRG